MINYITNLLNNTIIPGMNDANACGNQTAIDQWGEMLKRCGEVLTNKGVGVEIVRESIVFQDKERYAEITTAIQELVTFKICELYALLGNVEFSVERVLDDDNETIKVTLTWVEEDISNEMVLYEHDKVTELPDTYKTPCQTITGSLNLEKSELHKYLADNIIRRKVLKEKLTEKPWGRSDSTALGGEVMPTQDPSQAKPAMSIIRFNLLTDVNYRPYCGNHISCNMPRTHWTGEQFKCPHCDWVSQFEPEFITLYKTTHKL